MAVLKKPGKPKTAAAPKAAAAKKTSAKKASQPAPAASPAKVSDYSVGDRITHPMFGEGVVTAIEAAKLTIDFADGVTKQIVDYYVKPRKA
jgi:hypothetical protein